MDFIQKGEGNLQKTTFHETETNTVQGCRLCLQLCSALFSLNLQTIKLDSRKEAFKRTIAFLRFLRDESKHCNPFIDEQLNTNIRKVNFSNENQSPENTVIDLYSLT